MGTYFDKKKLLDDNQDVYISDYDKGLPSNALSEIVQAKKSYGEAEKYGDTKAMQKANDRANSIRRLNGSYSGGADGSEYSRTYEDYEISRPNSYKSGYDDKIDALYSKISGRDDFSYDPENDPLYKSYQSIYNTLGNDAYDRALSENSLRTGGMSNSSAQSAAMQAQGNYNSMLAAKVPELYKLAYQKYSDETKGLYDQIDALKGLDQTGYDRQRDTVKDFEADRDYFNSKDQNRKDTENKLYQFDTDTAREYDKWANDSAYKKQRDIAEDEQWRTELDYKKAQDEKENQQKNTQNETARINAAVNLAQALYAKVPVGSSYVQQLLSMLK